MTHAQLQLLGGAWHPNRRCGAAVLDPVDRAGLHVVDEAGQADVGGDERCVAKEVQVCLYRGDRVREVLGVELVLADAEDLCGEGGVLRSGKAGGAAVGVVHDDDLDVQVQVLDEGHGGEGRQRP
ncbi:hypothetical protein [Kitasatospora atroaurantiaca]|uniref:hypothetical protein n=1 Tax=Kitasatospora atroaurantiaca TaxID=285545 RepID=UPI001FE6BFF7|nr:hypothetical protein [Kitasatospora atroaurantiaca]